MRFLPTSRAFLLGRATIVLATVVTTLLPALIQAQSTGSPNSIGISQQVYVDSQDKRDGLVISHQDSAYTLSSETYDKSVFGVIARNSAVEFTTGGSAETVPVITSGLVPVLVTAKNGNIAVGDSIATSDLPGIAMKATKSGFVVGVAQEAFNSENAAEIGSILVTLDIKFSFASDSPDSEKISRRLLDIVSLSTIASLEEPTQVMRYVIAAIVLLGSLLFGFASFFRSAHKGIDALGRNPLAKNAIVLGIALNTLITLAIIGVGIVLSYTIITK